MPTPSVPFEKRILGAEFPVDFSPDERVHQVMELGRIAQTIKGGRLDSIMNSHEPTLDLARILKLLAAHEVRCVVVGGYAVAFHGYPRFTRDLNLFYEQTESNSAKIIAAFAEYGFQNLELKEQDLMHPRLNYKIGFPPNQLDLNPDVKGLEWNRVLADSMPGSILGQPIQFVSFDHLIASKQAAGRPQDLADIDHLMRGLAGM